MNTHLWTGFEREVTWCGLDRTETSFFGSHNKETITCIDCFESNFLWVMRMIETSR